MMMKYKIFAVFLSALLCCTFMFSVFDAAASTTGNSVIEEDFACESLDEDVWETEGEAALRSYGNALTIRKGQFAQMIGWKGLRDDSLNENGIGNGLTGDYDLEFTVSLLDTEWIGVYIGEVRPSIGFSDLSETDYGSVIILSPGGIQHFIRQGVTYGSSQSWGSVKLTDDGTRYSIKLSARCGCGELADGAAHDRLNHSVDVYIAETPRYGNPVYEKVCTLEGVNTEGYFGFGSINNISVYISDIRVTDTSGNTLYEPADLSGEVSMIEYISATGSPQYHNYEWRVWQSGSTDLQEVFACGPFARVSFNGEGALTNKYALQENGDTYSQFDIEFLIDLQGLSAESFGLYFQKDGARTEVLRFLRSADGIILQDTFGGEAEIGSEIATVRLCFKLDKKVDVYVGETYAATLNVQTLDGCFGFASKAGQQIELIRYSCRTYTERSSTSDSFSIDFSLQDQSDGRPYVNPMEIVCIGNIRRYRGYNELAFNNAGSTTMVATRNAYSEYVVKFDIVDIVQGNENNILVFSFAKDDYDTTFKTVPTIIFVPRGVSGTTVGYANVESLNGLKFTQANGSLTSSVRMEKNIFNDPDLGNYTFSQIALNVMFVVKNRTITLYYKYSNEPESALAVPRAVCYDVDTYGHFSISGNNSANFSIRNLSLVNLVF